MFTGTNLLQGKDIDPKEYTSYWFEYPSTHDAVMKFKTEDKNGSRQNVKLNGADWQQKRPAKISEEKGRDTWSDICKKYNLATDDDKDAFCQALLNDAKVNASERYPDEHPVWTIMRIFTLGSERELRTDLAPPKLKSREDVRKATIKAYLAVRGGVFNPMLGKKISSVEDITAMVNQMIPDEVEETEEVAA